MRCITRALEPLGKMMVAGALFSLDWVNDCNEVVIIRGKEISTVASNEAG